MAITLEPKVKIGQTIRQNVGTTLDQNYMQQEPAQSTSNFYTAIITMQFSTKQNFNIGVSERVLYTSNPVKSINFNARYNNSRFSHQYKQ